jgi:hypothetical protein
MNDRPAEIGQEERGTNGEGAASSLRETRAATLAEHYQKTYELALHLWERRNRQFVTLAAVLAVAAVCSILQDALITAARLYLEGLLKDAKTDVKVVLEALPQAYNVVVTFLLVAVFYLMANLYHRSSLIVNYYSYLGRLERDLRADLGIGPSQIGFTREGEFYRHTGRGMSTLIRLCYKLVLFALLALFFTSRMLIDWPNDLAVLLQLPRDHVFSWVAQNFLFVLDVLLCVLTTVLFLAYAFVRAKPDSETGRSGNDGA